MQWIYKKHRKHGEKQFLKNMIVEHRSKCTERGNEMKYISLQKLDKCVKFIVINRSLGENDAKEF